MPAIELESVVWPAHWAPALLCDDESGLSPEESALLDSALDKLASAFRGRRLYCVDVGESWFTWQYRVHVPGSQYLGGAVAEFVFHVVAESSATT